ncbi:MAG TPA: hypothetical protein VFH58_02505 [Acidimicrobiales bacterium]|nr:hypothetical protein [Acidimicrobiales bacterium]
MTAGAWTLGLVVVACVGLAPYLGARRLVRRLAPAAAGAPAVLASAILTLTLITLLSELLGSIGEFRRWPLVLGSLLVGGGAAALGPPGPRRVIRHRPDRATLMAAGLAVVVGARWAIGAGTSLRSGVATADSVQYHLPFAATFAQSGWLSRVHYAWLDPVWSFYPYGSAIFHSIGMEAFGRDVLSPVLNLGWLALVLLAAWCCGARWGSGPVTLAAGCAVLALPMLTLSQPGSANADTAALALLLSAVALLFTVADTGGGYLLAALAAGLAAGTTLYALPPVIGLALGVVLFDRRRVPGRWPGAAAGLVLSGSYWYVLNLVRIGNPVPGFRLGPLHLPAPGFPIVARYGFSVAHYLPHGWFWSRYVGPGLHFAFGPGWPLVAVLAAAGSAAALSRMAPSSFRPVVFASGVAAVAYVFTPTSAYGQPGHPFLFAANLRFLLPSVAWLLMVGGVVLSRYRPGWLERRFQVSGPRPTVWVGLFAILALITLAYPDGADRQWTRHPLFALAGAAAGLAALALALVVRADLRLPTGAALGVVVAAAALPVADRYQAHRYAAAGPVYSWARSIRNARIGTVAFAEQYPLFGPRLDNRVSYVGTAGAHHSLVLATSCRQWRRQLAGGRYDFVVIGDNDWTAAPIPQLAWTRSDPAARTVVVTATGGAGPGGTVFRLAPGAGTTAGC